MFSIGEIRSGDGSYTCMDDHPEGNYRMFMLHDGVLVGALPDYMSIQQFRVP